MRKALYGIFLFFITVVAFNCSGVTFKLNQGEPIKPPDAPPNYVIKTLSDASKVASDLKDRHIGALMYVQAMSGMIKGTLKAVKGTLIVLQTDIGEQREDLSNVTAIWLTNQ